MTKEIKIKSDTVTIDASGQIIGRMAVNIANILRGKDSPNFLPYKETGRKVIVFNTDKVSVTPKKAEGKIYYHHSGYPGGIKKESLGELMERNSRLVVRKAVYGMLPKNKLRDRFIKNLTLYKAELPGKTPDGKTSEVEESQTSEVEKEGKKK